MTDKCQQHGAFSWCELLTSDVEAAKRFYGALFGWEMEEVSPAGMPYTMLKAGGNPVGGIMTIPAQAEGMAPQWGTYVTVEDVDATAKKAEELGAQICVPPTDIPSVGRFCVFRDPQGASIAAITYNFASTCG